MGICGRLTRPDGAMDGDGYPRARCRTPSMDVDTRAAGQPPRRVWTSEINGGGDTSAGDLTRSTKLEDNLGGGNYLDARQGQIGACVLCCEIHIYVCIVG